MENYEEFLEEMNVGILLRKAITMTMSSLVMEITKDCDQSGFFSHQGELFVPLKYFCQCIAF